MRRSKKMRRRLSSDAKIIWALMKKQPRSFEGLRKKSGLSRSQFYPTIEFMIDRGIVKEIKNKPHLSKGQFALFNYTDLEEVFILMKNHVTRVSLDDLAQAVGKPPTEIEREAYRLAQKYEIRISSETYPPVALFDRLRQWSLEKK